MVVARTRGRLGKGSALRLWPGLGLWLGPGLELGKVQGLGLGLGVD